MKHIIASILISFTTLSLFSCLDDDSTSIVTYDDTAVSSASFGTLVRVVNTKTKDGLKDSTYNSSFTGTYYPIHIDQLKHTIYNVDSLPKGTKMDKLLLNISTKNSGIAALKSIKSDSVRFFSATDSLDFSQPRTLIVYSNSGAYLRKYEVNFVAHKEEADVFTWSKVATCDVFKNADDVKCALLGNSIIALTKKDGASELYSSSISDGKSWTSVASPAALSDKASMISANGKLLILDNETLYSCDESYSWSDLSAAGMASLVGICNNELFAINTANEMCMSTDMGANWTKDAADASVSFMPSNSISSVSAATKSNNEVARIVMVGNRDTDIFTTDSTAVVWSKIVEATPEKDMPWGYQEFVSQNRFKLPNMDNLSITPYHEGIIAIGGASHGKKPVNAYEKMYYSIDNGLSWQKDSRFSMPENFSATSATIITDADNFLWIIATGSGDVWKGRLSQLGWERR